MVLLFKILSFFEISRLKIKYFSENQEAEQIQGPTPVTESDGMIIIYYHSTTYLLLLHRQFIRGSASLKKVF